MCTLHQGLHIMLGIPPKVAPVPENTAFLLFAKQFNMYSYLNHHFGMIIRTFSFYNGRVYALYIFLS